MTAQKYKNWRLPLCAAQQFVNTVPYFAQPSARVFVIEAHNLPVWADDDGPGHTAIGRDKELVNMLIVVKGIRNVYPLFVKEGLKVVSAGLGVFADYVYGKIVVALMLLP